MAGADGPRPGPGFRCRFLVRAGPLQLATYIVVEYYETQYFETNYKPVCNISLLSSGQLQ